MSNFSDESNQGKINRTRAIEYALKTSPNPSMYAEDAIWLIERVYSLEAEVDQARATSIDLYAEVIKTQKEGVAVQTLHREWESRLWALNEALQIALDRVTRERDSLLASASASASDSSRPIEDLDPSHFQGDIGGLSAWVASDPHQEVKLKSLPKAMVIKSPRPDDYGLGEAISALSKASDPLDTLDFMEDRGTNERPPPPLPPKKSDS